MQQVTGFITDHNALIILGLVVVDFVLLLIAISLWVGIRRITRRRNAKLDGGHVGEIVDYLTDQSRVLDVIKGVLEDISNRQDDLDVAQTWCVQGVGMARFDAYDDVGGEQSFALALLDANRTGVVVSSLYGRQDCRVYIKGINKGEGERALSEEERRAVSAALRQ